MGRRGAGFDAEFRDFLARFRVVTPTNLRRPDLRQRPDILAKKLEAIKQEAQFANKGIGPVVHTLTVAGIARPVAELTPLMTVNGRVPPASLDPLRSAGLKGRWHFVAAEWFELVWCSIAENARCSCGT